MAKKPTSGHVMLGTDNFRVLINAINEVTSKSDDGVKAGLRLSLGYLLKKCAGYNKAEFIIDRKDDEVKKF